MSLMEETKSYIVGTTCGWVNNTLGPKLNSFLCEKQYAYVCPNKK